MAYGILVSQLTPLAVAGKHRDLTTDHQGIPYFLIYFWVYYTVDRKCTLPYFLPLGIYLDFFSYGFFLTYFYRTKDVVKFPADTVSVHFLLYFNAPLFGT